MKQLLIFTLALLLFSCNQPDKQEPQKAQKAQYVKPVYKIQYKIVKDLKEKVTQKTNYKYKLNLWKMEPQLVPNIHTNNEYIVVYEDKTFEELPYDRWITLSIGDTITRTIRIN